MWRWYTAADRRQSALTLVIIAAGWLLTAGCVLVCAGPIAGLVAGHGWHGPGRLERWASISAAVVRHPTDAQLAFPHHGFPIGLYWAIASVLGAAASAGYGWAGREAYRLLAPTGTGFATRTDIARDLSTMVCRARAKTTRPDLTGWQRHALPPSRLGIPLHTAEPSRTPLWLPLENATGVIAPQQSGKTLMDLLHKAVEAPGGLLVTSTKLDLFLLTALTRERAGSTVHLLDLTGAAHWPRLVRWNPIQGCNTVKSAKRRAQALAHAAATEHAGDEGGSNHAFFQRRAIDVLTAYLLAGALTAAPVDRFLSWCQNDLDTEAADALRTYPQFTAVRRTLQQAQGVVDETRTGIWETVRDAVGCLTDPDVAANTLPVVGATTFDPEAFIRNRGTLYIIGSEDDAAAQAPLITAFVQEIMDTARRLALDDSHRTKRERLDPPFTAVLDEIASICPLPDLPSTLSDSAGRGVLVHYALQSPAQAHARWGRSAETLFDNTTALTFLGGLKSEDTLKWASLLAGRRYDEQRTRQNGVRQGQHVILERADTLEPAAVRQIPRGRALLIVRTTPPAIVRLRPAWRRRDWKQLVKDAAQLRSGQATTPAAPGQEATAVITTAVTT